MGKSPAKWIKTLLFGKKSSRSSHSAKGRDGLKATNDKDHVGRKGSPISVNSPVISGPVLVTTERSGIVQETRIGVSSNITGDGGAVSSINQDVGTRELTGNGAANDPEKLKEEQAATKAQAAFRGFLARRAFRALKGIIRLQALVRGHLVRRQAVATLRCMYGIVVFQAMVRGWKVRHSGVGLEVSTRFYRRRTADAKTVSVVNTWRQKVSKNAFVRKLLSASAAGTPLWIQYNQGDPNSVISWLERWTSSCVWKPLPRPKKTVDLKSQPKKSNYTMETESGRSKRSVRRNSTASPDLGPASVTSEREKPKRNFRKVSSSPADSVQEHPQTELEKVKRNLRKVSNLTAEQPSDQPNAETEKLTHSLGTPSSSTSEIPDQGTDDSAKKLKKGVSEEKVKKDTVLTPDTKCDAVTIPKEVAVQELVEPVNDNQSNLLQGNDNSDNLPMVNGELNTNEEQTSSENQKHSKRRASFSGKSECTENGVQNIPTLPSYMAATESAKAKLRGQGSPRLGSDSAEKNGSTRRHSLPSANGKSSSHSPRTQRLVQASGKGSARNDRSLLSSRDGNEKVIQVEWRR